MREGLPLLRRARRGLPRRRTRRRRRARSPRPGPTSAGSRSGPVLAVMPWNFPLWQVDALRRARADGRQRRPAQARLQRPADRALPRGRLAAAPASPTVLPDPAHRLATRSRRSSATPGSSAATLTGSEGAGRAVAAIAGRRDQDDRAGARRQRPVRRDALGRPRQGRRGRDHRALPEQRAELHRRQALHRARRLRAGVRASCSPSAMSALVVGDPTEDKTDVGPLATEQGRDDVEELVDDAVDKGATVLVRRGAADGPGWFYPPTAAHRHHHADADVRRGGLRPGRPAVPSSPTSTRRSALANDTDFGLGSNAWTNDPAEQERFVDELEAGVVFINGMTTSYPELPVRRASRTPGTAASSPRSASGSSATPRPCGSPPPTTTLLPRASRPASSPRHRFADDRRRSIGSLPTDLRRS